ncbi:MAG: VCBS repeat-containing protein [Planctomycetales bacterium]|nr:VCBS repeat-containing protein [Planctomycetales bacterium]
MTFCVISLGRSAQGDAPSTNAETPSLFQRLTPTDTGIDFVQPIDVAHPQKYLYVGGYASAGVAIGDINGDGLQDLFFSGGPVPNRLYLNVTKSGQIHFQDMSDAAGIANDHAWAAGVAMVDIDGDDDLDIYVCYYDSPNQLYINQSTKEQVRFVESAKKWGLDLVDASFMPTFCDYDRDGDLDLFITGYQYINPAGRPATLPMTDQNGKPVVLPEFQKYYGIVPGLDGTPTFTNVGRQDYLLQSNAAGANGTTNRFRDVTKQAGISGVGVGNSAVWWDYNQDGWPDLYVGNDFKVADQLFRNNHDGTFTDVIEETVSHTTWFSMGSEVGDINNDGILDFLISDMAGTTHYRSKVTMGEMSVNAEFLRTAEPRQLMRNALFIGTGTTRLLEAAYLCGLANSDWTWSVKLADLDNDGRQDVFFTNGAARMFNHSDFQMKAEERIGKTQWDMWEDTEIRQEENLAFQNLGDFQFQNVSQKWGLNHLGMSYSAAYGDLDNDGDLDLIVTNLDEPVHVYQNQSETSGKHFLRIRLRSQDQNRSGLGAEVHIEANGLTQVRQNSPMMGFLSCNEPIVHFGLGDARTVDRISIRWPDGSKQELTNVTVDQVLTVTQDATAHQPIPLDPAPLFTNSQSFPALRHIEQDFDDFARQPLLPFKHSQLGPSIAIGDIDGDGDYDFYMGKAKGTPRAVYTNGGRANLSVKSTQAFRNETSFEDMGAIFLDADRDGDQDLYVVSGGVECDANDQSLQDRLYLNDGKGVFQKASASTMPTAANSGSIVCAADYDQDGDLDLFVGGRIIPGRFPETPNSLLLENRSTVGSPRFVDRTPEVAADLASSGLVTSALWSDANGDGWLDLWVTYDWGPVRLFLNEASTEGNSRIMVDRSTQAGLADRLGWWNGIAGQDLDHDGDIDYVVTNFGLNTTYHPTPEKPELLYYGKFDESGHAHLIEAKFEDANCFPRRGLSCSSHAMPFIRDKVKTFHDFGLSTLEDIYSPEKLDRSLRLAVNSLESGILINEGSSPHNVKFRFQPLPRLAQISPSFGVVLHDFDLDGWTDCFLAQNFFSPQVETGRMDSGLSLLLKGQPSVRPNEIAFQPVWPKASGIMVPGDAKSAVVMDYNRDGVSDLLVGVNNGIIQAFDGTARQNRSLRIRLKGLPGNVDAIGAKVRVRFAGSSVNEQVAEVYAGSGYLSQSAPELVFGCGENSHPVSVTVHWPDGATSEDNLSAESRHIMITHPQL